MTSAPRSLYANAPVPANVLAERLEDPAFWHQLFPRLSIGAPQKRWEHALSNDALQDHAAQLKVQGYGRGEDRAIATRALALARHVQRLVALSISPVFIFLFDQTWALFHRQARLFRAVLGDDYRICTDYWCWHVDPQKGEAGWTPHRDQGRLSVGDDGTVHTLQLWIPLVEANAENGCVYVLPADRDPRYRAENEMDFQYDLPNVRALPAKPGEYLFWNGALLHWGGRSSARGTHPRISVAVTFQRLNPPRPYTKLVLDPAAPQDFAFRLAMVAKQLLQYKRQYPIALKVEDVLRRLARPYVTVLPP